MRQASPTMIQQQLYTRERSGIFRGTEGFDTVAASDGLDSVFIKKQLHPFCGYDAPAELTSRGEKEAGSYPHAIHLFHTESGDTVLGRSIYQPVDFTGLRSAFLTHNYVIPPARQDEVVIDYRSYLEADYAERYYTEIGRQLPELEHIPQRSQNQPSAENSPSALSTGKLLQELKLDEKSFKQLLFAVMTAVGEGRKKVYVALDVPADQISVYALALLKVLFACLPFEQRRRFGFITYAKEPQSRKYIHLQFVERGSLRPNDRGIEKEYVFDLASGRLPQDEVDEGKQPYLDFVWNAIGELESLEGFHRFADEMLSEMDPQRRALLSSYHELCVFYQLESDHWDLYENHKITVLRGLLSYLEPTGALDSRIRLNDIFLAAFDREFDKNKQGNTAELTIVECFRDYYRLDSRNYGPKFINYLIHAINNALTGGKTELAYSLYSLVESQSELSRAFFGMVLKHGELTGILFEPYLRTKLAEAKGSKEVLNVVHSWVVAHPDLLRNAFFKNEAAASLTDKLRKEQRLLSVVHTTLETVRKWGRTSFPDSGRTLEDSELAELLSCAAKELLLNELDLDKLTLDQVTSAAFLGSMDAFAGLQLEGKQRSHAAMLRALYEWFAQREPTEDIFRKLSSENLERIQRLGRKWQESNIEIVQFGKIVLAFYQDSKFGTVDFNKVLDYLQQHAKDKEKIYEFMLWSQGHPYFAQSGGLAPGYSSALLSYFKKHDRDAFKSKDYRIQYFDKAGAPLAKVFAEARLELLSPFKRFLVQNGKKVRVITMVLISSLVVISGILLVMQQQGMLGPKAPVETTSPPTPVAEPEVFVYADNVAGEDGNDTTSLVFLFAQEEQCKTFAPAQLTIESPNQTAQQYSNLKYDSTCTSEKAGTGDSEGTDPGVGTDGADKINGVDAPDREEGKDTTAGTDAASAADGTDAVDATNATKGNDTAAPAGLSDGEGEKKPEGEQVDGQPADTRTDGVNETRNTSRVTVSLGMKLDVPAGSLIKIGDQQLTVITREEAESKISLGE
ncbi:hypothetical protein D3C73_518050 [compost metagenome]